MSGRVTVVIPNFNGAPFLREAVESALVDPAVGRVVAVDDGSTDESLDLLNALQREAGERLALLQTDGGACVARNAGLEAAETPLVKFLDSDDVLESDAVSRQASQREELDGDAPISLWGDVVLIDEAGARLPDPPAPPTDLSEAARMIEHPPLTASPLHRVEDVRAVGGFDPRVPRGQEHDLHLRMWLHGVRFVHRHGVVYRYRQHDRPRISTADGRPEVARGRFEAMSRHLVAAKEKFGDPLPSEIAEPFARQLWRVGRRSLQSGLNGADAAPFFAKAKSLAGRDAIVGGRGYRALTTLLGPALAERLGGLRGGAT